MEASQNRCTNTFFNEYIYYFIQSSYILDILSDQVWYKYLHLIHIQITSTYVLVIFLKKMVIPLSPLKSCLIGLDKMQLQSKYQDDDPGTTSTAHRQTLLKEP